jgi:hypothetical protein
MELIIKSNRRWDSALNCFFAIITEYTSFGWILQQYVNIAQEGKEINDQFVNSRRKQLPSNVFASKIQKVRNRWPHRKGVLG